MCLAALLRSMPEELYTMRATMRAGYTVTDLDAVEAGDPMLLEHRDFIYEKHLELPIDF